MYLHPQGVTDELIDAIVGSDVVVSYFDLSLQHFSAKILKGMGRWGGRDRFERIIGRIRGLDPLAGIRATFILGFPGETDADADEVVAFVNESDLDWIGVFEFSREAGTRSHDLDDQVPGACARERAERVSATAEVAMDRRAASLAGARLEVLAERRDRPTGLWIGRSKREAPEVDGEIRFITSNGLKVGDYTDVVITGNEGADLIARPVGNRA